MKILRPTPPTTHIEYAITSRSFVDFVERAFPVLEPSTEYQHNWHINLIAEYLQLTPQRYRRLVINIPPRYMKSLLVSVLWPCWLWLIRPTTKFLFCSYSASLALKHSIDRQRLLESEWYRGLVAASPSPWQMSDSQNTREHRVNTAGGMMYTTSVGGTVTGKGGDIVVIDDPMDPRRALSDVEREKTNQWIDLTISTRLDQPQQGAIVLIMQRLHQDDTTGHLLNRSSDWHLVRLPNPPPHDMEIVFPLSGRRMIYRVNTPLWPEREDVAQLERQRTALGSWGYAGQYLQSPAPLGGGIIKREWLRYWHRGELPPLAMVIQSWDLTFKEAATSYVCGQVWGVAGPNRYLLDMYREQAGFVETMAAIEAMTRRWPDTSAIVIEDKANGPAVVEALRGRLPGVVARKPQGSKTERLSVVAPLLEAGNVYFPADAPWLGAAVDELCNFPAAQHDDVVDALSQALYYLRGVTDTVDVPPPVGSPEHWQREAERMRRERLRRMRDEARRIN